MHTAHGVANPRVTSVSRNAPSETPKYDPAPPSNANGRTAAGCRIVTVGVI
jgi:hypothetical protein